MKKTVIGSGVYVLDAIVVRDYPAWPQPRPFADRTVLEEVGKNDVRDCLEAVQTVAAQSVCFLSSKGADPRGGRDGRRGLVRAHEPLGHPFPGQIQAKLSSVLQFCKIYFINL